MAEYGVAEYELVGMWYVRGREAKVPQVPHLSMQERERRESDALPPVFTPFAPGPLCTQAGERSRFYLQSVSPDDTSCDKLNLSRLLELFIDGKPTRFAATALVPSSSSTCAAKAPSSGSSLQVLVISSARRGIPGAWTSKETEDPRSCSV